MANTQTVTINVSLLEEGTPTWKRTMAEVLGAGRYQILATPDYDPEDEIWEFVPGEIVHAYEKSENGENTLVAMRPFVSREQLISQHPDARLQDIYVMCLSGDARQDKATQAIDLGNGLYKILPSKDFVPGRDVWEFSPGSIVRLKNGKSNQRRNIKIAFDQIREDRMNEDYAVYVRKLDQKS
jgi:hypothetical protein